MIKNENGVNEWVILDMQGRLEINGPVNGEHFGDLKWKEDGKTAQLIIGHQLLEGELIKLEKPFLVVDRNSIREQNDSDQDALQSGENMLCDVVAIVRKKIVFSERPKPIISAIPH